MRDVFTTALKRVCLSVGLSVATRSSLFFVDFPTVLVYGDLGFFSFFLEAHFGANYSRADSSSFWRSINSLRSTVAVVSPVLFFFCSYRSVAFRLSVPSRGMPLFFYFPFLLKNSDERRGDSSASRELLRSGCRGP